MEIQSRDKRSSVAFLPGNVEGGLNPALDVEVRVEAGGFAGQVESTIELSALRAFREELEVLLDTGTGVALLHGISAPELTLALRREAAEDPWVLEAKISRRAVSGSTPLIRALRVGFIVADGPNEVADQIDALLADVE